MSNIELEGLQHKLEELKLEHRDLDDVIHRLQMTGGIEQLQLQRLKKRKLKIKEQIIKIEDELIPDILA
ncbi:MAG: YdcH family protein [Gammaproteobacteria bacterium]